MRSQLSRVSLKKSIFQWALTLGLYTFANFLLFAQPSNTCNGYTGTGIPVSEECILRGFNIEPTNNNYWTSAAGCNASSSSSYKDAYWWFEATSTETVVTYYPTGGVNNAGYYDPILTIFSANQTCATNMSRWNCVNNYGNGMPETITLNTVIGSKYLIRIQNRQNNSSAGTAAMYGQICVANKSVAGDEPCTAVDLNVNGVCKSNWFSNSVATRTTSIAAPPCGWNTQTETRDVWFKIVMPSNDLIISTERNGSTSMTSSSIAIYKSTSGGCTSNDLTYLTCSSSGGLGSMAKVHLVNGFASSEVATGTVLYVRVWATVSGSSDNSPTKNGIFGICAYEATKCGNPIGLLNDFCENPATMYKDPISNFSASTAGVFTGDQFLTTNESIINQNGKGVCLSQNPIYIHNNSWYQFTATATTETFPFSTSCNGIQALIFEVTHNAKGCCTGFKRVSNCHGRMPQGSNVYTLTATDLTIGNTYVLMVDGFAGAQCDFVVHGWNAVNVLLSIELDRFYAVENDWSNTIHWSTETETNNSYFELLRSYDGLTFEKIATIEGAGTSQQKHQYEWEDKEVRSGNTYYRLQQTDYDGKSTSAGTIAVDRKSKDEGITRVYPNPATNEVTVWVVNKQNESALVQLIASTGQVVRSTVIDQKGNYSLNYDLNAIHSGVYTIKYTDANNTSYKQLVVK
jgi:hypothetical protein